MSSLLTHPPTFEAQEHPDCQRGRYASQNQLPNDGSQSGPGDQAERNRTLDEVKSCV